MIALESRQPSVLPAEQRGTPLHDIPCTATNAGESNRARGGAAFAPRMRSGDWRRDALPPQLSPPSSVARFWGSLTSQLLSRLRGSFLTASFPRLAPWAAFLCRLAATQPPFSSPLSRIRPTGPSSLRTPGVGFLAGAGAGSIANPGRRRPPPPRP